MNAAISKTYSSQKNNSCTPCVPMFLCCLPKEVVCVGLCFALWGGELVYFSPLPCCLVRCQSGHYLKLLEAWKYIQENGNTKVQAEAPSVVIQNAFNQAVKSGNDTRRYRANRAPSKEDKSGSKGNCYVVKAPGWHQKKKSARSKKGSSNKSSKQW